jgi:hypothetical protein
VCRAQLSLSNSSARHLRVAQPSALNAADSLLREALAEASAAPKKQQATLDMCAEALVEHVLLRQNNNWQGAEAFLKEYKAKLSSGTAKVCAWHGAWLELVHIDIDAQHSPYTMRAALLTMHDHHNFSCV